MHGRVEHDGTSRQEASMGRLIERRLLRTTLVRTSVDWVYKFAKRLDDGVRASIVEETANQVGADHSPILVEFVGAPAVGKTTLMQQLLADPHLNGLLAQHGGLTSSSKAMRRPRKYPSQHQDVHKDFYAFILQHKVEEVLQRQFPTYTNVHRIQSLTEIILNELILYSSSSGIVLWDEGLTQHFSRGISHSLDSLPRSSIPHRRIVLFLSAPGELIASRAIDREF